GAQGGGAARVGGRRPAGLSVRMGGRREGEISTAVRGRVSPSRGDLAVPRRGARVPRGTRARLVRIEAILPHLLCRDAPGPDGGPGRGARPLFRTGLVAPLRRLSGGNLLRRRGRLPLVRARRSLRTPPVEEEGSSEGEEKGRPEGAKAEPQPLTGHRAGARPPGRRSPSAFPIPRETDGDDGIEEVGRRPVDPRPPLALFDDGRVGRGRKRGPQTIRSSR